DKGCLALIFWGAPIAMENDLGRALEFVSALQARPEFRIAAGLTCGLAHAGFMGSPAHEVYSCNSKSVNLAARLMSAAPLGEVYLDTAARDRGLDRFDIEFVDHLDLKGFTDPQAAYRLTGTRRAPVGLQISGAMIGRDADLSTLQDDLSACLSGEGPCTAALAGEAGIGKTHLIAELQARGLAGISDVVWHELNADGVLEQPFAPFGRFIASLAGILPDGSDTQRRADFDGWFDGFLNGIEQTDTAAELTRTRSFLAALVDVTQDDDVYQRIGQELREINTARGLRAVFAALSLGGPVILIADDLQYYDAQSRAVLKALADAALPGLAILLVSRLTDAEDLPPLPVAEADLQTVHRLHRLPRADVQALAEQVLGAAVSSDIVDLLSSRSGGNPFYLEQLLLTLGARGALVRRGEGAAARLELRDDAEESLPIGISDLLVARLDKLPAGLREIVQVASVIAGTTSGGQDIDEGLLTALLEDDPDLSLGVEAFIADGLEQHIWDRVSGGAIRFRHTLLRDVAYDMLVSGARRDLHLRAARVLEQMAETPGVTRLNDLAHHFERAGQLDTARQYLEAAGELAQKQYQSVRAIGFFRRLAQLGLPSAQDVEVSIRLGELLNLTGQWEEAAAFLEQALAGLLGAEHRRTEIDILIKLGDVIRKSGDQIRARERLDLARVQARRSGDLDLRCRALAVLAGSHKYAGDYARSLTVYQEALALAEETGDTYLEGVSLAGIGSAHGLLMNCADAAAYNRRAIALLEETGDRLELLYPLVNLGTDLFTLGDDAGALEVLERCLAEADAIGDREGVWIAAHFIGRIELRRGGNGDMGAATAFLVRAMQERAEVGGDSIPFNTAPFLAEAKLRAGDAAGALDLIVRDLTAQHDGAADHEHGRTHLVAARLWRVGEADPESGFQTLARLGPGRDAQAWLKRAYELSVQGGRLGLSTRIAVLLEFAHWLAPDGPDAKIAALVAAARRLAEENDLSAELVEIEAVCVALGVAETDIAADDRLLRPFD
ncbi:MAG: AAA family ATPase, partial [Pseudomonadota bacterium]